jgi:hypothetical protein
VRTAISTSSSPRRWPFFQVTPTVANPFTGSGALTTRIFCGDLLSVPDWGRTSELSVGSSPASGTIRTVGSTGAVATSELSEAGGSGLGSLGATISSSTTPTAEAATVAATAKAKACWPTQTKRLRFSGIDRRSQHSLWSQAHQMSHLQQVGAMLSPELQLCNFVRATETTTV